MDVPTYYELLGVDPSASTDGIRSAYRRISSRVHPDHGGTSALFCLVQVGYETLSDPIRRSTYDHLLFRVDVDAATAARDGREKNSPRYAAEDRSTAPPTAVPVGTSSFAARHPSLVVSSVGSAVTFVGLHLSLNLFGVGMGVAMLGVVGLVGSGRARACEPFAQEFPPTAGRRFGEDLRKGVPMVLKAAALLVLVLGVREWLRSPGRGRI